MFVKVISKNDEILLTYFDDADFEKLYMNKTKLQFNISSNFFADLRGILHCQSMSGLNMIATQRASHTK